MRISKSGYLKLMVHQPLAGIKFLFVILPFYDICLVKLLKMLFYENGLVDKTNSQSFSTSNLTTNIIVEYLDIIRAC